MKLSSGLIFELQAQCENDYILKFPFSYATFFMFALQLC